MILAAGLGTRLKPFTDHHPKALVPIAGKPVLQHTIEYLYRYGIREIIINVHHFAEQIMEFMNSTTWPSNLKYTFSDERAEVLETGGGLLHAADFFSEKESFIMMNADMLTNLNLAKLIAFHQEHLPIATVAITRRKSSRCLLFNSQNRMVGWRNTVTGEEKLRVPSSEYIEYAFSGIHCIQGEFLKTSKRTGKFSMIDWYLDVAAETTLLGFDHSGDKVLDVGKPEAVLEAEQMFEENNL